MGLVTGRRTVSLPKGLVVDEPLHFESYLRPMVWGGRRLEERLGKRLPGSEPYGEAWEISDHASHSSRVADGSLQGRTLGELMRAHRHELLNGAAPRVERFPLLIKLLDANDWLSVQVHPDDANVGQLWPGEGGKTEAWFVLDAAPGSRIYAGLMPGVDETRLRQAIAQGTVAQECLHSFAPQPGDCLFLPAGTVHAVGGGVLMAEVQQTSDATFRLFDWNRVDAQGRSRTLHVEEGIAAIDWSAGPRQPLRVPHFREVSIGSTERISLVSCPYFDWQLIRGSEPIRCGGDGRLHLLTIVHGGGRLAGAGAEWEVSVGQTWLLPACLPAVLLRPHEGISLLLSTVPHG